MPNTTTTIDFSWGFGRSILPAGTPVDAYGNSANDSNAVGIVAESVYLPNHTATVITAGTWDEAIGRSNGIVLSVECKRALPAIRFSEPVAELPELAAADAGKRVKVNAYGTGYVLADDITAATETAAGTVKRAAAVADAEEGTEIETINALISTLVASGALSEYVPPEPSEE